MCSRSHIPASGGSGMQVVPVGMACLHRILSFAIPTSGQALWYAPCPVRLPQIWSGWALPLFPPMAALRREGGGVDLPLLGYLVAIGGRMAIVVVSQLVMLRLRGSSRLRRWVVWGSHRLHQWVGTLLVRAGGQVWCTLTSVNTTVIR